MDPQTCPSLKTNQYRKVVKPLLERRRRARINSCLGELKDFIVNTMKHDHVQASKLEKADILEQTVQYLRAVRMSKMASQELPVSPIVNDDDRFLAGFAECAHEVSLFVTGSTSSSNMHPNVTSRLLSHLSNCAHRFQEHEDGAGSDVMQELDTPTSSTFYTVPSSSCRSQVSHTRHFHDDHQRLWRPW